MKIALVIAAVLLAIILLGWLGLKIQPASFPAFPQKSPALETIPLPAGLPAPVERFYRKVYGDRIPVIETVVMTGRATLRPAGNIVFPSRFRFTHEAGKSYRHYFESTVFGLPLLKVNEAYLDGKSSFSIPFGASQVGPKTNQAANLGMWAELSWVPAVFLTDARVRWEPLDDFTAILVVPFEQTEEHFVVRFNPENDMLRWMEVMRYQNEQSPAKSLWITESVEFGTLAGNPLATKGSATWMQDGKPWAVFAIEDIQFNVDVREYIHATGL